MTDQPLDPHELQRQRLFNQHIVSTQVCAQCYGALVEKYVEHVGQGGVIAADWFVVCPKGCQPGGFVDRAWADQQRAASAAEFLEVAQNYPQLAPPGLIPGKEERDKQKRDLYGE